MMISGMKMSIINGFHQTLETLLLVVTDRSSPFFLAWPTSPFLLFLFSLGWESERLELFSLFLSIKQRDTVGCADLSTFQSLCGAVASAADWNLFGNRWGDWGVVVLPVQHLEDPSRSIAALPSQPAAAGTCSD
jgi:hypothetical protein